MEVSYEIYGLLMDVGAAWGSEPLNVTHTAQIQIVSRVWCINQKCSTGLKIREAKWSFLALWNGDEWCCDSKGDVRMRLQDRGGFGGFSCTPLQRSGKLKHVKITSMIQN